MNATFPFEKCLNAGENGRMNRRILCHLLALFIGCAAMNLDAQGTAFSYQGQLSEGGSPANGSYDLQFSLYDAPTNGNLYSGPLTNLAVAVSSGLFTTNIDFGPVFNGTNYWLAIGVRTNGSTNAFTALQPLQPLLPVPYAIFANSASNLIGTLPVAQLAGTLSSTQLAGTYSGAISFTNTANSFSGGFSGGFSGSFSGNGSGLANLNGSQVTSGTVADARLSANVALLNTNQTFTGTNLFTNANSFTNRNNSFIGSFFGNGLVGWIPVSVTSTQAMPDAGYLLLSSSLTTVILPPTNQLLVGDIVRVAGAGSGGWQVTQNTNESVFGIFLSAGNSPWVQAAASSTGWRAFASSASGQAMVATTTGSGGIYTSTDYGQTWGSSSSTFTPSTLASSSAGNVLVGASTPGGVIVSTNSGTTWNLVTPSGSSLPWTGVAISADGTKFAACISNSTIYVWSGSGGTIYAPTATTAAWSAIACSATCTQLVATVYGGGIYISTNFASTWYPTSASPGNWSCVASSAAGTKLVAAINGGGIYSSVNAGGTWTQLTNAPGAAWSQIACSSDGGRIVAVVDNGPIYVSANFGQTWTKQTAPVENWLGVACSADGTKVAAGYAATATSGAIYYWQANSQSTSTTSGVNGSLTGPQGSSVELQYIGGGQFMPVSSAGTFWAN